MKSVGLIVGLLAVAVGEGLQFGCVAVAPRCEPFAVVQDVGFVLSFVTSGDGGSTTTEPRSLPARMSKREPRPGDIWLA